MLQILFIPAGPPNANPSPSLVPLESKKHPAANPPAKATEDFKTPLQQPAELPPGRPCRRPPIGHSKPTSAQNKQLNRSNSKEDEQVPVVVVVCISSSFVVH